MGTELEPQLSLTPDEVGEFAQLEVVIEEGQKTFMQVAAALYRIRDGKLYRETHRTFEAYCQERWGFRRAYANQLIAASSVMVGLDGIPAKPQNPAQAVELLPLEAHPGATQEVWLSVVDEATATGTPITAARVKAAVRDYFGRSTDRPSAREAQAQADRTGNAVLANDGMWYPPTRNTDQTWITITHWAEAIDGRGLSNADTIALPSGHSLRKLDAAVTTLLEYLEGIRAKVEQETRA